MRSAPPPVACTSVQNAGDAVPKAQLVRITHPFHPFRGRELICVGERFNRYGRRVLLQVEEEVVCSVPPQWTDLVAPDPELAMGDGRAFVCIGDLLELARLVAGLCGAQASEAAGEM
jgi:Family of unknown function (DUF5372)